METTQSTLTAEPTADTTPLTTKDAYRGFLSHIERLSSFTQHTYNDVLKQFVASMPAFVDEITPQHIDQYILTRRQNHKVSSCNNTLSTIKSLFGWLEETYDLPNPAKKIKCLRGPPPKRRILSPEEYEQIIETVTGLERDIVMLLTNTGLRASEFLSLRPESINEQFITVVGKGQKERSVPMNEIVKSIIANSPDLFDILKHQTRSQLRHKLNKAAATAGIKPFCPHACRRYFATELARQDVSIIRISKLLGHSSVKTTEIYLQMADNDLIGITDVLVTKSQKRVPAAKLPSVQPPNGVLPKNVYWSEQSQKYMAVATYKRKKYYLGYYYTPKDASEAVADFRKTHPIKKQDQQKVEVESKQKQTAYFLLHAAWLRGA